MSDLVIGMIIGAGGILLLEFFLIAVWCFMVVSGDNKDE